MLQRTRFCCIAEGGFSHGATEPRRSCAICNPGVTPETACLQARKARQQNELRRRAAANPVSSVALWLRVRKLLRRHASIAGTAAILAALQEKERARMRAVPGNASVLARRAVIAVGRCAILRRGVLRRRPISRRAIRRLSIRRRPVSRRWVSAGCVISLWRAVIVAGCGTV